MFSIPKVIVNSTLRGYSGWNGEEVSSSLISIIRRNELNKDEGWDIRLLANIYCILEENNDYSTLFMEDGKFFFGELTAALGDFVVNGISLKRVAEMAMYVKVSIPHKSGSSPGPLIIEYCKSLLVDLKDCIELQICTLLNTRCRKTVKIISFEGFILSMCIGEKTSCEKILDRLDCRDNCKHKINRLCNFMALAHRFDLRESILSCEQFCLQALKLFNMRLLTRSKIIRMYKFLISDPHISHKYFKEITFIVDDSKLTSDFKKIKPAVWEIYKMRPEKKAYYLGFNILTGIPDDKTIYKAMDLFCEVGAKKYYKKALPKWEDTSEFLATDYDSGGKNILYNDFSDYNPCDVLSYRDGNKVYKFTRDSLMEIMTSDVPQNPYNRQPFSEAFILKLSLVIKTVNMYEIPESAPMITLYKNLYLPTDYGECQHGS